MLLPLTLPPAAGKPVDVVGVGLNSIDLIAVVAQYPRPNTKQPLQSFARLPGGQTASAMVACSRLGWRTRYIGHFGDDDLGREGRASLEVEGVDVTHARTIAGVTNQFSVIVVDRATGERTIMWQRPPGLSIDPDELDAGIVTAGRVLLVDCHDTAAATRAASYGRAAGVRTVVDVEKVRPGIQELLRNIDVIIAAEEFPSAVTGVPELGRALGVLAKETGAPIVTATMGREGSLTIAGGREMRLPAFAVDVVDSTGAGDVFRGGFIAGWLTMGEDAELEDVLRYATAVAALKCRALGARQGIPRGGEVVAFLREVSAPDAT